jgi:hypothetical protein
MCEKNIKFYRGVIDRLLPENLKEDVDGEYKTNTGDLHKGVGSGRDVERVMSIDDYYAERDKYIASKKA